MHTVWIIEKNDQSNESIASMLMGNYAVRVFRSMQSFRLINKIGHKAPPDAFVIDTDDIAIEPEEFSQFVCTGNVGVPVLLVSSRSFQNSWINDPNNCLFYWVPKPLNPFDFIRFIRSIKDSRSEPSSVICFKNIALDQSNLRVTNTDSGLIIDLTSKELKILNLFMKNPYACLSREQISREIWKEIKVTPRTIDSYVSRLRMKLRDADFSIESVYGGGYVVR